VSTASSYLPHIIKWYKESVFQLPCFSGFDQRKQTNILAASSAFDSSNVLCFRKVSSFP